MLRKYSVKRPNEIRMKILDFCSFKCEYSNRCFSMPLSNCCVKHNEIKEFIKPIKEKCKNVATILVEIPCEQCGVIHELYFRKDIISFSVNNKLYSKNDILSVNGRLVCIECKHRNLIKITKFLSKSN